MPKISQNKVAHEIRLGIEHNKTEIGFKTRKFAEQVRDYWRDKAWPQATGSVHSPPNHPWSQGGEGSYEESIYVKQNRNPRGMGRLSGRFLSSYTVGSDHPNANFIEFGTNVDKPGSRSPWGPDTPTPEYAPAARTAHHFRGTAP